MSTTTRFPAHLRLIGPAAHSSRPAPPTDRRSHRRTTLRHRVAGVLDSEGLWEMLERVGTLAPTAPLSFLVIRLHGLDGLEPDEATLFMRLIASRVRGLTRATDAVGRIGETHLGVLLQGTGATAAAAVAARVTYHLAQAMRGLEPAIDVQVSAATGTGVNWNTLPLAAMASLPEAG